MKIFAERLKELRTERKLSTTALGNAINVSDTTVCRWENSQADAKGENLKALAKFFNVSADFLLGLKDSEN